MPFGVREAMNYTYPMAEPTTRRLVLAISSALKLNIDHLDIKTAFLNGEIPENEQFFLLASTRF